MAKVETKHPEYVDRMPEWRLMRDANRGVSAVHESGEHYLPMPSGFRGHSDEYNMYAAYKTRARFPEIIAPTLRGMMGLIHRTEAQVEGLPESLMPLWEKATSDGLPLETFHRRITSELLLTARYTVLTDIDNEVNADLPFFAGYQAEGLINWDNDRSFFVLDESGRKREGFLWKDDKKFRELAIEDGRYIQREYGQSDNATKTINTRKKGATPLDFIPIVVATPRDLSLELNEPPLIGVARAALAIYQLDADYRHQLFWGGQETLVVIGPDNKKMPKTVGAGVVHGLPQGSDAKYIGPSGRTIDAHRTAINDAKEDAIAAGGSLFDQQSGQESGEALRIRYAAQTATLTTISQTSAQALEGCLRHAARFMGFPEETVRKIVVKPNLRFVDTVMTPEQAKSLVDVWMAGAISHVTLYENLQRGEIASAERTLEDEQALIEREPIDQPILTAEGE